jgi:hypothetical protein
VAEDSIGLAEFLAQVKQELLQPDAHDDLDTPLLALEQVEVEVRVTVAKEASGKLKVYVVEAGGGGRREDVHTVRLTLQPLLSHAERIAELKQDRNWPRIVSVALQGTLKSAGASTSQRED